MTHANHFSAGEAAAAIRRGDLTSQALVTACLSHIFAREPEIAAWTFLDPHGALAAARAADRAVATRQVLGPLHGVPIGIKDIIDTARMPTECGSPVFADRRPKTDAPVVAALIEAGAIILGKTVTTELAFFSPGPTANPHDASRTPGGSSSGSAAAVADFHVPLTLGTQTAGSILRPASFCGAIGFKPTFGAIPVGGVLTQSAPLDTIGGFARDIDDMALLAHVLMGSPMSLTRPLPLPSPSNLRLAFVRTSAWPQGEPVMIAAFERFVSGLDRMAEEVVLPESFDQALAAQRTVQFHDIARNYGPLLDTHPNILSQKLVDAIAEGRAVSTAAYEAALALREPLYAELTPILSGFDAILTPAAPGPAPLGLASTGLPTFNALWTFLGVPALSLPILKADQLPLGVQLVGTRGADARLFDTARALTAHLS